VRPPKTWSTQEPESFVTETEDCTNDQPAISQKKKAKKAREAKRKAKKQSVVEETVGSSNPQNEATEYAGKEIDVLPQGAFTPLEAKNNSKVRDDDNELPSCRINANGKDVIAEVVVEAVAPVPGSAQEVPPLPLPEPMPITKHGKHMHWTRFVRKFLVDQLTNPLPASCSGCSHSTPCPFENSGIPDCPFHEPRRFITISREQPILT
jgi:hypothetical protein